MASRANIREAIGTLIREEAIVVEGASAATIAALTDLREAIRGRTVVLQLSGRNLDREVLREVVGATGP